MFPDSRAELPFHFHFTALFTLMWCLCFGVLGGILPLTNQSQVTYPPFTNRIFWQLRCGQWFRGPEQPVGHSFETFFILLSSSRPCCSNYCVRLVKSKACTLPSEPDKAVICSVSTPPSALTSPFNIRPGAGRGCDWQWVSKKDCKPLWYSRKRLFESIVSLSCLSSILSNGMLFVSSIETQVVKRLRLFLLNTVSLLSLSSALWAVSLSPCHLYWSTHTLELFFSLKISSCCHSSLSSKLQGFV